MEFFYLVVRWKIDQLKFWQVHLGKLNFKDIFESHKCSKIVYYDATSTRYAGYEINTVNGISHGIWSDEKSAKSSTWRELMAVCRCLKVLVIFWPISELSGSQTTRELRLLFARVL